MCILHSMCLIFYQYAVVCIIQRKTLSSFILQKTVWQASKCPKSAVKGGGAGES